MSEQRGVDGGSVVGEFLRVQLGDARLNKRLQGVVAQLEQKPDASFPQAFTDQAELEAFYRLVRNGRVNLENVLAPHVETTRERCSQHPVVLAVHDTSEFRYGGEADREGLGRLKQSGKGFLGHFTLAVVPGEQPDPLGVLRIAPWARTGETVSFLKKKQKVPASQLKDMETEQARWAEGARAVEAVVGTATQLIHVMDSEGDDYATLAHLHGHEERFVVRMCHERRVVDAAEPDVRRLTDALGKAEQVATRTVRLSRRGKTASHKRRRQAPRDEREAKLQFAATTVTVRRTNNAPRHLPKNLDLNVVHVQEVDPPADVEPVEWRLATTEPIDTPEQILAVVDYYRGRWIIEEYFKALKTGCAMEKRQLESADTLFTALGILAPIAWSLLRLRTLSRTRPEAPAREVLSDSELRVLQAVSKGKLPADPTVREAMLAVAKMGGHLKSNGEPGWLVLGRGYEQLRTLVEGFELAMGGVQ